MTPRDKSEDNQGIDLISDPFFIAQLNDEYQKEKIHSFYRDVLLQLNNYCQNDPTKKELSKKISKCLQILTPQSQQEDLDLKEE